MRLAEQLQPPEPRAHEVMLYEARERRRDDVRKNAMAEVLEGYGPFWAQIDQHRWDNEQEMFIFAAVNCAVASHLTDSEFRSVIMAAVKREAAKYAEHCAEEID